MDGALARHKTRRLSHIPITTQHTDAMGKWHPAAGLAQGAQAGQERL